MRLGPPGTTLLTVTADQYSWPADFLWGVGTSAHQNDGNNVASDYWAIEHRDGSPFVEPSGDALNSYHLWPHDMALAAELGFTAYRFSVEWARIEPARGCFSTAERDRYSQMVDTCRRLGLEPVVTLHHMTHPAWFARAGGWRTPGAVDRFAAYAEFVAPALADVRWLTTINEPNYLATLGHWSRFLADGDADALRRSVARQRAARFVAPDGRIVDAVVRAHTAARTVLRERTSAAVGWSVAVEAFEPLPGAEDAWRHFSRLWQDPFLEVARDDDWVGIQVYTAEKVGPDGPVGPPTGAETTQMGWEFRPDALGIAVRHTAAVVPGTPIVVTENGVPVADDTRRVAFIEGALTSLHAALDEGADVRGYCHWTFLDNFEWEKGYATTFGLVAVDRATFRRTPKPSAHRLGAIARTTRNRPRV
jgi:beta-glucosidase